MAEAKVHTLLLLWQAWHLRNDVIHGNGISTITGSAKFQESYNESLMIARRWSTARQVDKGKGIVFEGNVK
jgi:hypothetical protein